MAISFDRWYALLLIPILLSLVWLMSKKLGKMNSLRRSVILFVRNLVIVLLVLALAGFNIQWTVQNTTTIFVVDASDSMGDGRSQAEQFVREAAAKRGSRDRTGVVAFGGNALVESFVSGEMLFDRIETRPDRFYTNIENALSTALTLFPRNTRKRIVLVTDGEENAGSSTKLAASLEDMGIELKVHKLEKAPQAEVAVDALTLPQRLRMGEAFSIAVTITGNVRTGARLILFNGKEKAAEQRVELQKGENRFVFRDQAAAGGFVSYRVLLEPDRDTETRNNEASAFSDVLAKPRVLLLEDRPGESEALAGMLRASGMDYDQREAGSAPGTLEGLAAYKTIISCDVSAENFNEGFLNALEAYVRDLGGGFIATGGENSFALGGYFKTPLEKVLPVNMTLQGKKEIPDMSIVLVIDKSGSMTEGRGGITKLDLAKEAAARTLDSLRPKDRIGVIAFDDTVYWVVETQKAEEPERIRDDIGTIRSGGGTSILPALQSGYASILQSDTKIKHIILLTDGQAEKSGYKELVEKISRDHITVSTVAVGEGADVQLLRDIAEGAGGRFYYTDAFSNLPRIFAKETFIAARAYLNHRPFTPAITSAHPVLAGVAEEGLPQLLGYVAASPKNASRVVLASDEEDPILTLWQYGLGKTAAWNSDVNGKWSANYAAWDKNLRLWQNLINWTIEKYGEDALTVETRVEGGKGVVTLSNRLEDDILDTQATVVSPGLESSEAILYPTAPGQYSGSFDLRETGAYLIKAYQKKDGETVYAVNTGLAVPYSPEFKPAPVSAALDRLVAQTGGSYIRTPEEVFRGEPKAVSGSIRLTPYLLVLALLLFMLDVALRRLNLPIGRLEEWLLRMRLRLSPKRKPTEKSAGSGGAKSERASEQEQSTAAKLDRHTEKTPGQVKEKLKEESLDTTSLLKKKRDRT